MKKIVLITTGQPATNPRIIKEADSLHKAGFDVMVLYSFFIGWAFQKDTVLLQQVEWKYKLVGGSPYENKGLYFFTRLRYKLAAILNNIIGNRFLLAERTQARCYDELLHASKNIAADWYIGHNLGALAIAVNAAKYHKSKAGFDFEDYHRGENMPSEKKILKRMTFLEDKYVPSLVYFSTASSMITQVTKRNHPYFKGATITLLNSFPLAQQPAFKQKIENDRLQLFWFSQTIGVNRGLEVLMKALKILDDSRIHLTLAGSCSDVMLAYLKGQAGDVFNNIHFAGIIQPENLPAFASQFDVGLAIELPIPENRDICLTNKIFTYLLAGNAVILSKTAMQADFNKAYRIGNMFEPDNEKGLAAAIKGYQTPAILNTQKRDNYQLANTHFNWEKESEKLLAVID